MDDRNDRIGEPGPYDARDARYDGRDGGVSDGAGRTRSPGGPETAPQRRYDPALDREAEPAARAPRADGRYERPVADGAAAEPPRRPVEPASAFDDTAERERRRDLETRARIDQRNNLVLRAVQVVDYLFYLLYALLGVRFVLTLLGANESAGFAQFINNVTQPFYGPFSGIVARPAVNGGFLDFPLIIAVLAYLILHFAVRGLLRLLMANEVSAVRR